MLEITELPETAASQRSRGHLFVVQPPRPLLGLSSIPGLQPQVPGVPPTLPDVSQRLLGAPSLAENIALGGHCA